MNLLRPGGIEPVGESPRALTYGFFAKGTYPRHRLTHSRSFSHPSPWPAAFPSSLQLPLSRSHPFQGASGTIRLSDHSPGFASHFAFLLIGLFVLLPDRNRMSSPGVTLRSSRPCRPQTPWYDGWMSSAFASILQARPCPIFGRPVHRWITPRLRPGPSPHALRIPPRDGHPALQRFLASSLASETLLPLSDMTPLI